MRRLTRQRALLMVAALLVAGAAMAQVIAERNPSGPPLSSRDSAPTGALALARWLERLGYRVNQIDEARAPEVGEMFFILGPLRRFERAEAQAILDWVRRGGTLVYVPSLVVPFADFSATPGSGDGLGDELDVGARFGSNVEHAAPSLGFFTHPPASRFQVKTSRRLELRHDDWAPLIQDGERVFAATRQLDAGRVYVTTSDSLLANEGIAAEDNPAFLLNILARHQGRRVASFEEYHHLLMTRPDLADAMRGAPWGWALSSALLLSFFFVLWAGRRFGPAVVQERVMARSGGDYVVSFAGLLQKARAGAWVQEQYAGLVRRRIARALRVRADLTVVDLARLLAERGTVPQTLLAEHLTALDGPPLSQRALLGHVRAVEQMLSSSERSRGPKLEAN